MPIKLELSTTFLLLSFSLTIHFAWPKETSKALEKVIEDSKNRQVTDLECHVCHSETDESCFNFTDKGEGFEGFPEKCTKDHRMCVVKKFAFTSTDRNGTTTPMKTFSVKRNCTNKCEDGCVIMGERTRLYVCSQCCVTPLCNVGSGSGSVHQHIDNSFQYFLTSVANVNLFAGTFHHTLQLVQMCSIFSLKLLA